MCENPNDLGRQEPRGCRYVYGDPGAGEWHFCQRTITPGGAPGKAATPPYCARHTKVCVLKGKPFSFSRAGIREPNVIFQRNFADGSARSAVDVILKLQERGVFLHD